MVQSADLAPPPHEWWSHVLNPVRHLGQRVAELFSPSAEAAATSEAYEIALELPGISDDDIRIEAHSDRLVVTGEKRAEREERGRSYFFSERVYGRFRRVFRVPGEADLDKVSAVHKDGVLTISVPKLAGKSSEMKRVSIKRG